MSAIDLNDLLDETMNSKDDSKNSKNVEDKKAAYSSDDNKLVIGLNDKNRELFIPEKSRFLNTLVLGTKGTGKTTSVLPMFVEQDLKRKNAGVTIISSSKEMSYNLYSLAKKYKRKIHFIKPSIDNEVTNKFLWMQDYNYDYINETIINYKEAIKKKEVVIIDMEILKYKSDALKAVAMLLLQLRLDIQETDITQRCHHFLYVDDAQNYLKFLEDLLIFSDSYNLGVTLFMQSRSQLVTKNRDYTSMVDNNVRNTMLLNNITIEDYNYYKDKFFEKTNPSEFFNRDFNTMLYETIDSMGIRRTGITRFKKLLIGDWDELEAKSKKIRASLLKEKRKERELELREKYLKSIEEQKEAPKPQPKPSPKQNEAKPNANINAKPQNEAKQPKVEPKIETKPTLSKEPKPVDSKLLETLTTSQNVDINKIKPRDFNIKKDNNNNNNKQQRNNPNQAGAKPNFNPPKTGYDLDLEQKTHKTMFEAEDLGSIKPKQGNEQNSKPNQKPEKLKFEGKTTKDYNKQNPKDNKPFNQQKENKAEAVEVKIEEKPEVIEEVKEPVPTLNPIELQKQKEEEAIKLQEEIDRKIQEQIKNEENERKRLVATRIFNNYNDGIEYCNEVFEFKYE